MQKIKILIGFLVLTFFASSFKTPEKESIHWLNFKELKLAYEKEPRPIIIDVYTNWCGWCKVMDKETYTNEKVINYINEKYYAVKFDAETHETQEFGAKKYGFNNAFRANELAVYLLGGSQLSFPTTVLLTGINDRPQPIPGYMKPAQLEMPLKFFGEGAYKNQSFQDYMKNFSASW